MVLAPRSAARRRAPCTPASVNSGAQIVEKFRALVATVVDGERASSIERTVLGLEQLEDADELLTLLGAPVRGQDQSSQGSV